MNAFKRGALASACLACLALPAAADPLEDAEQHLRAALALVQAERAMRAADPAPAAAVPAPVAAPPATAAPAAAPPAPAAKLAPGAVVTVRPAPTVPGSIPTDSVGEFVHKGEKLSATDPAQHGINGYHKTVSFELAGLLVAKDKGRYQVGFEGTSDRQGSGGTWVSDCTLRVWVEDAPLPPQSGQFDNRYDHTKTFSVLSGVDLDAGVYKVRAWVGCADSTDKYSRGKTLNLLPLIMRPSDKALRPLVAEDLMHRD